MAFTDSDLSELLAAVQAVDPALEELRLRPWAHMLGFRGHFSTKSRLYSTTLTKLRSARLEWRNARLLRSLGCTEGTTLHHLDDDFDPDAGTVLTVGHWQHLGRGHTAGQSLYARTILRQTITIDSQRTRGLHGEMIDADPKTKAGRRSSLALPDWLMAMLAEVLASRGVTNTTPDALVFVSPDGTPLH